MKKLKNVWKKIVTTILAVALCIECADWSLLTVQATEISAIEENVFNKGDGTEENPYLVSTAEQLDAVRNDLNAYYVQINDIDLSQYANWVPIGNYDNPFIGNYDGSGYTIKNLTIGSIETPTVGLFGVCGSKGKLMNINIVDLNICYTTDYVCDGETVYVGGITGSSNSIIENCSVSGNIDVCYTNESCGYVGGIVGDGEVENCSNYSNITMELRKVSGQVWCGGITGFPGAVNGVIEDCKNYGNITGISGCDVFSGGVSGADGYITNCVNYGEIYAAVYEENRNNYDYYYDVCAGGIVGCSSGEIWNSLNYGNIYCYICESTSWMPWAASAGGIAGDIGFYSSGKISKCYSFGKVVELKQGDTYCSSVGRIAGSISGYNQIFFDNYASADMLVNGSVVEESECGATTQNGANYAEIDADKITLIPANGSDYVDTTVDGKTIFRIETLGTLEIAKDDSAQMVVRSHDIMYKIYGNGKVEYHGKEYNWADLDIEVNVSDNLLEIKIPDLTRGEVEVEFWDDFLKIDGQAFNTYIDGLEEAIHPWKFNILPDTYDSFSFDNYSVEYISKDVIANLFPAGQINKIYKKNLGSGGICYGMSVANAGITYDDFLKLSDFQQDAIYTWDLDKDLINSKEDITLDEFLEMCHVLFNYPSVNKVINENRSKGNNKNPEKIEELVSAVKNFKSSGGTNPVIVSFSSDDYYVSQAGKEAHIWNHAALVYDYVEEEDKTTLIIYDSNYPGIKKKIELYKSNGKYTGEWKYNDIYKSGDLKGTYITYSQPLATLEKVYYSADKSNNSYILEIPVNNEVPEIEGIVKFIYGMGNTADAAGTSSDETELYWVEDGTAFSMELDGGDFSLSGNTTEISCNNLGIGSVEITTDSDDYNIDITEAVGKDSNISYAFYNDTDTEKVTIYTDEISESFSIYNNDKDIYVSGAEEVRVVYEEGIEDESGNYTEIERDEKIFSDLSEKENYSITLNEESDTTSISVKDENGNTILSDSIDNVIQKLKNAKEGSSITMSLGDTAILSKEVLEAMQGKNITLRVKLADSKVYTINGADVSIGSLTDTDLSVTKTDKESGNILIDTITSLAGSRDTEQLIFGQSGAFDFTGQLTFGMTSGITGNKGILLQQFSTDGSLTYVDSAPIIDNSITFTVTQGTDSAVIYGTNGDTNGDNQVNIKDLMQILYHVSARTIMNEAQKGFADVDMNNSVNIQDLMRELYYVSGRNQTLYEVK